MEEGDISRELERIEGEVTKGNYNLRELGFWRLVSRIKMEYASYLRASPLARAAMHASGAVVTNIVPLAPAIALTAITFLYILTDIFYSTQLGDWGYALRELRSATR